MISPAAAHHSAPQVHLLTHPPLFDLGERLPSLLTGQELEQIARFRFDHDRRQRALVRGFARLLLSRRLALRPEELAFCNTSHGKPHVVGRDEIGFNLSHTSGAIVVAVSAGAIGVDVEGLFARPFPFEIAARCFTHGECAALASAAPEVRGRRGFEIWVRKEALLKADGRGLSVDPRSVSVLADGHDLGAPPVRILFGERYWRLHDFCIDCRWICSVAAPASTEAPQFVRHRLEDVVAGHLHV